MHNRSIDITKLLEERAKLNDHFVVQNFPGFEKHKIGVDQDENICVFIFSSENDSQIDFTKSNFQRLDILFNKKFILKDIETKKDIRANFSVLVFKSDSYDLVGYFLEISFVLLEKIGDTPNLETVKEVLMYLIQIFEVGKRPSMEAIQGLWAEIFTIRISKDPNYLTEVWHNQKSNAFDFSDGQTKLEIKSSKGSKRNHKFSLKQLNPNPSANLVVASYMMIEISKGSSIQDLISQIQPRLTVTNYLKFISVIHDTLGDSLTFIHSLKFDYNYALEELKFYNGEDIPSIRLSEIPKDISNVKFDVNLEGTSHCSTFQKTKLLEALGILDFV